MLTRTRRLYSRGLFPLNSQPRRGQPPFWRYLRPAPAELVWRVRWVGIGRVELFVIKRSLVSKLPHTRRSQEVGGHTWEWIWMLDFILI